nr:MAG TPA: hypothetical protein [Caudoviricetes sp.]
MILLFLKNCAFHVIPIRGCMFHVKHLQKGVKKI